MKNTSKTFWAFSVIALIWNLMGVNQYLQQAYKTDTFKSMYTPEQYAMIEQTPSWAMAAFALAVFSGALGCILLLFRKKSAQLFFVVSILGIIIQMYYNLFVVDSVAIYGPGAAIMPIMILLFAVALLFFTLRHRKKGTLS